MIYAIFQYKNTLYKYDTPPISIKSINIGANVGKSVSREIKRKRVRIHYYLIMWVKWRKEYDIH